MDDRIRGYDPVGDAAAVVRLWREIGWLSAGEDPAPTERFLAAAGTEVGLLHGEPECAVAWMPGSIRYQDRDLPLAVIRAVTTSLIARREGLATAMTARALAAAADQGAAVATLGIFDQGFYDRLGFGTGPYSAVMTFDPAALQVDHVAYRTPVRVTAADAVAVHDLLLRRHRAHGGITITPQVDVATTMESVEEPFGLGYRDGGRLTHLVFGRRVGEDGPFRVRYLFNEEPRQLLELLRLLHQLGDQVKAVNLIEPAGIQLQDLLAAPLRDSTRTKGSELASRVEGQAWWQLRILDLAAVVGAHRSPGPTLRFNLTLTDPLAGLSGSPWPGIGGDHVVTIGASSSVEPGTDPGAERLTASVAGFSRLWFGVRPASALALVGQVTGSPTLLEALDRSLLVPAPVPGLLF